MKITISDVGNNNHSIDEAIEAWAEESDTTASGVIGSSFSTSGPGSGWTKNHDVNDYAARALDDDYGAAQYVDSSDGRVATLDDEGAMSWTDESAVELVCPDEEDALANPKALRAMVEALSTSTHTDESDMAKWKELVSAINEASEAIYGLDLD